MTVLTVVGNTNLDVMVGDTDRLPAPGTEAVVGDIGVRLGGSAATMAVRAAQLGVRTRLVSRIGDDAVAGLLRAELDRPGLECELVVAAGEATPVTVAVEAPGRDRAFLSSLGAMAGLGGGDVDDAWLRTRFVALNGSFLLAGLTGAAGAELLARARAAGASTLLDTGWPPDGWTDRSRAEAWELLGHTDVFLPNEDEVVGLTGEADPSAGAALVAERSGAAVALKRGGRGAELHVAGREPVAASAAPTTVIDSTGAGDSFDAAFVAGLARGDAPARALGAAVRFASRVVSTPPARRGVLRD